MPALHEPAQPPGLRQLSKRYGCEDVKTWSGGSLTENCTSKGKLRLKDGRAFEVGKAIFSRFGTCG